MALLDFKTAAFNAQLADSGAHSFFTREEVEHVGSPRGRLAAGLSVVSPLLGSALMLLPRKSGTARPSAMCASRCSAACSRYARSSWSSFCYSLSIRVAFSYLCTLAKVLHMPRF